FVWGRRALGSKVGTAGALVLAVSVQFVYRAGMLTMDGPLCLCLVCAWAAGHSASRRALWSWFPWLLSAACCGLGALAKGPVALVLGPMPLMVFHVFNRGSLRRPRLAWLVYLGVALAVGGP